MSDSTWSSASPPPDRLQYHQYHQNNNQPHSALRKLMPASEGRQLASTPGASCIDSDASSPSAVVVGRKKRRQATPAACGACRKRKSKCDGGRPQCSICRDRKTTCEFDTHETETHTQALKRKYSELQSSKTAFEQVYAVLQTRSQKEAEEIFDRIRRGADANTVLRHVEHGDVLIQLSLVPEARLRYEFPYMPNMPEFLQRHDNPYLDSEVYEYALRSTPTPERQQALPRIADMIDSVDDRDQQDPYYKPYSSARVVHPLLESIKPSKWTLVSDDDVMMRKIIHDYFLYEYDWFTHLHIDYFLQDMANERPRFCSPLLVNAVLCMGCICHQGLQGRAEFWNPKNLGSQFFAEAKRLLEIEFEVEEPFRCPEDRDWERRRLDWEYSRLTTIQAALLLNLIHILNASDKIGWRLTVRALEMANEVDLFAGSSEDADHDLRCFRDWMAWAVFIWQSLMSYHYLKPPLLSEPPQIPLPDPSRYPHFYGELWVRFPLTPSRLPVHHGVLFKAKAEFWTILNEFSLLNFSVSPRPPNLSPPQIIGFYQRLRRWFLDLPEVLTPKKIVFPSQLKLHMHYCHVIIDLLAPALGQNWTDGGSPVKSLDQSHSEAILNLETLIRLYYLRHGFESCDAFLIHALGVFGFISIRRVERQEDPRSLEAHRSTVILIMKGIRELGRSYYVAKAILRFHASFMRPEDMELLKRYVDLETEHIVHGPLEQAVYSDFPVYEIGYHARTEQRRQGRNFGTAVSMASLSLEPSLSPTASRSPS